MGRSTRTFIALPIPETVGRQLAHLQRTLGARIPEVRWVEPGGYHATLSFLGEVADIDLGRVCNAAVDVARSVDRFEVVAAGFGAFPNPQSPRVVWVGLTDAEGRLSALHTALADSLGKLGYNTKESKYHPHVTLGRIRNGRGTPPDLVALTEKFREWAAGSFQAREILIYGSELGSNGPSYTQLGHAPLRNGMKGSKA